MKMLIKEWKLCMHPMGYIMPLCAALVLVPGYPYGVCCFYTALAVFFICLTAREASLEEIMIHLEKEADAE